MRAKDIACIHAPFSDAYHWGPEKLSERYEDMEKLRPENGLENYTYRAALQAIDGAKAPVHAFKALRLVQKGREYAPNFIVWRDANVGRVSEFSSKIRGSAG